MKNPKSPSPPSPSDSFSEDLPPTRAEYNLLLEKLNALSRKFISGDRSEELLKKLQAIESKLADAFRRDPSSSRAVGEDDEAGLFDG